MQARRCMVKSLQSSEGAVGQGKPVLEQARLRGPGAIAPWEPPGSCTPENGVGLGSLVDVYKWCVPGVHRGVHEVSPLWSCKSLIPLEGLSPAVWAEVPLQV
jgi:hypothetical protein